MKLALFACVTLAMILLTLSMTSSTTEATNSRVQRCQRRVRKRCTSNTLSCARFRRTNLCELFANDCQRKLANCQGNGAVYRRVNRQLCSGWPRRTQLACGSDNSSISNSSSSTPIIYEF